MTSSNRATKYESLHKSLKKHFKPGPDTPDRSVLDHLLYACCLEDARYEQADEAFAKLQQAYFDWNEVRVTTAVELGEALQSLPFSAKAGSRIKQCLQALFESRYQYDIDDLKKANLGKAIAELEAWKGITPFIVSYVSQHALGGHSIPISQFILDALVQCEAITPAEAEKQTVPGLERAIPKNKGAEFASLLHQFAVELHLHPKSAAGLAVLKDLGVTYKQKPKVEPKPANRPAATKANMDRTGTIPSKPSAAGIPSSVKATSKAEPAPTTTSAKKGDAKKGDVEAIKPSKMVEPKSDSKNAPAKKMIPPAATSKEDASKKSVSPDKKSPAAKPVAPKDAKKKMETAKGSRDESKNKQNSKPKPSVSKGKPDSTPATKKGTSTGKPTAGGSIASSITKKKPK